MTDSDDTDAVDDPRPDAESDDSTAGPSPGDGTAFGDDPVEELPRSLVEHLHALVDELTGRDGLFVALDFDGTLAAIVDRPEDATLPTETRDILSALAAAPNVEVAIVSGRGLDDVRERVDIDGVSYAGNHGLEIHAGEYEVHPTAEAAADDIDALADLLADQLAGVDGVIVENKGVTATVHYRLVDDGAVPTVVGTVESLVATRDDVRLTTGKDVLELRPDVEWDKGEAVESLYERLVPDGDDWLPLYVGDDTTDEAAFAVLEERGFAVKVGDEATGAPYRVADPDEVRSVLSWLCEYGVSFLGESDSTPAESE